MFQKAKSGQAKIKIGIYGDAGSGKTPVALLIAEGLNKTFGGRTAFIDTEHGTDFYVENIPERQWHPSGFDIDAEYTKSIGRVLECVKWAVKSKEHSVIVIDSLTHLWENAKATGYTGKRTKHGGIPIQAWAKIKAPFKELIDTLIESDKHVVMCGRLANMYEDSKEGNLIKSGSKMKSEGDTGYEPNILMRMTPRNEKGRTVISAFVEKDRSSILYGKTIDFPSFENIVKPVLKYLSADKQSFVKEDLEGDLKKNLEKEDLFEGWKNKIMNSKSVSDLEGMKKDLGVDKKKLDAQQVSELYSVYSDREKELSKTAESIADKIKGL